MRNEDIEALRNGLEDSHWYNKEDEETFEGLVRKASAYEELYAQAAKADEYEAKAKAWDKYKAHMESHIAGEINEEELVSDLKSDYFESGDRP